MEHQRGFTLIELVIVVILLAILASVALPRFLNITDNAHDANVSATTGALGAAISLSHAKWLAAGQPTTKGLMAGLDLTLSGHHDTGFSVKGWPNAATDGRVDIASSDILGRGSDSQICAYIATNLLNASSVTFGVGKNCGMDYCAAFVELNCVYSYQKDRAKVRKVVYNTVTGQVTRELP